MIKIENKQSLKSEDKIMFPSNKYYYIEYWEIAIILYSFNNHNSFFNILWDNVNLYYIFIY